MAMEKISYDLLISYIELKLCQNKPVNIIIAGPTCSGKTTLAKKIKKAFPKRKVAIISQDSYFKDLSEIPHKPRSGYLTDSIYAFDDRRFRSDAFELINKGKVLIPKYDVSNNKRVSEKGKSIVKGDINIFEGLHAITILEHFPNSINVYLSTSLETCLQRRIKRDTENYQIPVYRIREYFQECVIPMYELYIKRQKNKADYILNQERW